MCITHRLYWWRMIECKCFPYTFGLFSPLVSVILNQQRAMGSPSMPAHQRNEWCLVALLYSVVFSYNLKLTSLDFHLISSNARFPRNAPRLHQLTCKGSSCLRYKRRQVSTKCGQNKTLNRPELMTSHNLVKTTDVLKIMQLPGRNVDTENFGGQFWVFREGRICMTRCLFRRACVLWFFRKT